MYPESVDNNKKGAWVEDIDTVYGDNEIIYIKLKKNE